ncbi:MAG: PAS domain S-box protein [Desulforhopalus sp.]|nr:PAS domain S-box protein [Desulforhopalus sp.]
MDDQLRSREELLVELEELRGRLAGTTAASASASPVAADGKGPPDAGLAWERVFDTIGSAIWIMDGQCRIHHANKACEGIFKKPVADMIGRHCWQVAHAAGKPIDGCPVSKAVATKKRQALELEQNGRWLEVVVDVLHDPFGVVSGFIHIVNDITDKKEMEVLIRDSEERYRNIFQNNHAVLLIINSESGRIVDANPAACRYYGYTLPAIREMRITDINTLTPEQVFEEMARAKAEQRMYFNFSHRLASGEVRPVEVYSGPIVLNGKQLLYSIVHDISDRKKVEEERERLIVELRDALVKIKALSGLLPICASCKKIRDDRGCWKQMETYIMEHSEADFTHSICPDCAERLYPGYFSDSD